METRLNKVIQEKYIVSRRQADKFIESGLVFVNGKKAKLGSKVLPKDKISIENLEIANERLYFKYNKPSGVVTINAQIGEREIKDVTDIPDGVSPVGRLDKESTGLILFTNDGAFVNALIGEKSEVEKEYSVVVDKDISHSFLVQMRNGIKIGRFKTKRTKIRRTTKTSFDIVLTEGKNRQIRKMAGSLGYKVLKLKRFRIENIELGRLRVGEFKELTKKEQDTLFNTINFHPVK